ncbi:hypothetical protein BDR07DRAFT_1394685 [Suillus spraguei]|nr:hypothetical protein BDR07DRAFT_1394685 [Suillus spraguei]
MTRSDPRCLPFVQALSLPIPTKVDEAFKYYRYVPYTAFTHAARPKAFLCGEDLSFVFTQDGLTAKGLDRSNELSIATVAWVAAAKAREQHITGVKIAPQLWHRTAS